MALVGLHLIVYGALAAAYAPVSAVAIVLAVLLVVISIVDIQRFEIPDLLSALLVLTGVLGLWLLPGARLDHVIAGVVFPAILYLVGVLYLRMRGQPGLGLGDVKLAAGLGVWLGVEGAVWTLLAASLSGIAALVVISLCRKTSLSDLQASGIAFGPFLCLSGWAIWLQGNVV
jgi:leader peptidase (prepilin peptidase)/N-methyltransferase